MYRERRPFRALLRGLDGKLSTFGPLDAAVARLVQNPDALPEPGGPETMKVRLHHMARQLGQWVSYWLHRRRCIQCHRLYDFKPVGLFDPRTGEAVLKTIPMCRRCELGASPSIG